MKPYFVVAFLTVHISATSVSVDSLVSRLDELESSLTRKFNERQGLLVELVRLVQEMDVMVREPRQIRYRLPLGLGEKIETFDRMQANLLGKEPPCPSGFYLTPFLSGSMCVQSGRDPVSDMVRFEGYYGDCQTGWKEILTRKSACDVMVDVGAHIGTCSVQAAFAKFRVVALESNGELFRALEKTVELNKLQGRVYPVQKTVGHGEGKAKLSEILKGLPCVRLLKMDCEGCELEALEELKESGLLEMVDVMKIEVNKKYMTEEKTRKMVEIVATDRQVFHSDGIGGMILVNNMEHAIKIYNEFSVFDILGFKIESA